MTTEETKKEIYNKFDKLLAIKGVTAYKVAQATGISTTTLTNWKNGKYTPKSDKLKLIAEYFNVPENYFTVDDEVVAPEFDDEHLELIYLFDKMNKEQQELWLSVGRNLVTPK